MLKNDPNTGGNTTIIPPIEEQTMIGASVLNNVVSFDWEAFKRGFGDACPYLKGKFVDVVPAGGCCYFTKDVVEKYLLEYYKKNSKLPTNAECCAYFTAAHETGKANINNMFASKKRNFFRVKKV